jgi:transposase InsO family protein
MDSRVEFVMRALQEATPFAELCAEYGISRKTGYKWKERFLQSGFSGLEDLSRRPSHSPQQVPEDVLCELIRIKKDHRGWGPRKILEVYTRKHSNPQAPSESTVKRILEKAGLVTKRPRRKHDTSGRIQNRTIPEKPNELWTVDFKGWWYTGGRERCEPLTVRDEFSRFVLCANPLENAQGVTVGKEFERLFETYGLPLTIRTDNGSPFACRRAPLGLTKLSAWWIANGISLDRIAPARPDQNGGHERMHLDMAIEVERYPSETLEHQRAELETWRHMFNYERPHEAIGMRVPADLYQPSERAWDKNFNALDYPAGFLKRKVNHAGTIGIEGIKITVSTALAGWHVGLKPSPDWHYLVWFGALCLGTIDMRTESFRAVPQGCDQH